MTGDAGTPLTAKWQIIELDEAQGIGSVEIRRRFHPNSPLTKSALDTSGLA